MPLVLHIHRTSDIPYDYSMGLYYTILPNGLPDPLPPQQEYMSAGIHRGVFKSVEEAKAAMYKDVTTPVFNEDVLSDLPSTPSYYVIGESVADEDDIF